MKNKKALLSFIKSYLKSMGLLLVVSFLIFLLIYDMEFQNRYISNALFIPNILVFFVSLGINVGSFNIFNSFKYTFKKLVNPKKTKEEYENYSDYLEQKEQEEKKYWFLTVATITWLIVSLLFAYI